jgi:DNA-binding protein H-NS
MAMKPKRRGRPLGSKNKSTPPKLRDSVGKMDIGQLRDYIARLQDTLAAKIQQQRRYLESQLAVLQGYATLKTADAKRIALRGTRTKARAKPKPKYQSKKNKSRKWTGRGMLPTWMRAEMKGTKLKKDDFLIK